MNSHKRKPNWTESFSWRIDTINVLHTLWSKTLILSGVTWAHSSSVTVVGQPPNVSPCCETPILFLKMASYSIMLGQGWYHLSGAFGKESRHFGLLQWQLRVSCTWCVRSRVTNASQWLDTTCPRKNDVAPNASDAPAEKCWSGALWAPGTPSTLCLDTSGSFQFLPQVTDLALSQNRWLNWWVSEVNGTLESKK